jgi:anti-anti-sigma factor
MLKATTFSSESRIHETAAHGRVLEFVLTGAIPDERPDSAELARRAGDELKQEIARCQPRAVVVNLLDFDPSFGHDIVTLLLAPHMALAHSGGGEMAILATGQTATELDNFLKTGRLDSIFGTTHRDLASALAKMTNIPYSPKPSVPTAAKAESETPRQLGHGKEAPDIPLEDICPRCGRNLVIRNGNHGDFVVCAGYLKGCMHVAASLAAEPHGLKCPQCKEGELVRKKKPRGSFGCSRYPQCKFTSAGQPPMSIAEIAAVALGFVFMALVIAAMAVLLSTAVAFGGILRWVCLGVVLAGVAALLGGGRGGFLHYDLELQGLIFLALLIAAVVAPLAARGAPLALLWLIPGPLVVVVAWRLGGRVLRNRQRHGVAAKAAIPVAKQGAPLTPSPQGEKLPPPVQPGPEFLRERNGVAILQVSGRRFEFGDINLFENRFAALLQEGRKQIIIDLSRVKSIGATGVGALVRAFQEARKTGAQIKYVASPELQKVFERVRLATVFDIYSDEDSAVSACIAGRAGSTNPA